MRRATEVIVKRQWAQNSQAVLHQCWRREERNHLSSFYTSSIFGLISILALLIIYLFSSLLFYLPFPRSFFSLQTTTIRLFAKQFYADILTPFSIPASPFLPFFIVSSPFHPNFSLSSPLLAIFIFSTHFPPTLILSSLMSTHFYILFSTVHSSCISTLTSHNCLLRYECF